MVSGEDIAMVNECDAELPTPPPTLSVTEIVKENDPPDVGVPLMTPVEGLSANPGGSDPEDDHV
jgi:hypothetical protein